MTCPDCDSPIGTEKVGRVICTQCKTPLLVSPYEIKVIPKTKIDKVPTKTVEKLGTVLVHGVPVIQCGNCGKWTRQAEAQKISILLSWENLGDKYKNLPNKEFEANGKYKPVIRQVNGCTDCHTIQGLERAKGRSPYFQK